MYQERLNNYIINIQLPYYEIKQQYLFNLAALSTFNITCILWELSSQEANVKSGKKDYLKIEVHRSTTTSKALAVDTN